MGLLGTIGSFFSSACSFIGSAVSALGGALASAATAFLSVAGSYLSPVVTIIGMFTNLIGLKDEKESVEEIGAKAMLSDKKPEDFESYTEYINHLREDIKLDKEKFDKATDIEKATRSAIGATILVKGIEEKKGFEIPTEAWVAMVKLGLEGKEKEVDSLLETFKNGKLSDFANYVEGKLDAKTEAEVSGTLVEMYQKLEPNASIEAIEKRVMNMDKS